MTNKSKENESRSISIHLDQPQSSPKSTYVAVLAAPGARMGKRYLSNGEGAVSVEAYSNAAKFKFQCHLASGLGDLAAIVGGAMARTDQVLIRGLPASGLAGLVERNSSNFPEPPEGQPWAMFDFDGIETPAGMSPTSKAAIEWLVNKLPESFHVASYFYQFSSSSGILKADGAPLKAGVSAHVFFWFTRPVPGKALAAWLQLHCIQSGFYERRLDRGGSPRIQYGIDPSVLKSSVQPHYVALPSIGEGVRCTLDEAERQGLVFKQHAAVEVPELTPEIMAESSTRHQMLFAYWKRENGYKLKSTIARKPGGGVHVQTYMAPPDGQAHTTGRRLVRAIAGERPGKEGKVSKWVTLHFEGEKSPGSWYVSEHSPTVAKHHGHDSMPLLELSPSAYAYVRDDLKWIEEICHHQMVLTEAGWLPPLEPILTAKVNLVLAPTGSGKTTALCNYARVHKGRSIIVYAAQTIALTNQMVADLRKDDIWCQHYSDFNSALDMKTGVYVTTNESLRKFNQALRAQGRDYVLVVDEAHAALDDFMRSDKKNREFEDALGRARQTILLTGTMTPLQKKKLAETVMSAVGPLTPQNFRISEFSPVKSYPLLWAAEDDLGGDLVALMRQCSLLKQQGQPIPRTVILAPLSKMEKFRQLLRYFDLLDQAMVVSRKEASQDEIEQARTSNLPLLISSPLFALGLNFEHAPARLWTWFESLDVDTSQVIQTVNRANRTALACEVRLYAGRLDPRPVLVRPEDLVKGEIKRFLEEEADCRGEVDPHYQLDRLTYCELRNLVERQPAKNLHQLKADNSIQNYTIVTNWIDGLPKESNDKDLYKGLNRSANDKYDKDVRHQYVVHKGEPVSIQLDRLKKSQEEKRDFRNKALVPKLIEDKQLGILADISCRPENARRAFPAQVKPVTRLLGVESPFLSAAFAEEKTADGPKVAAQKTRDMVKILDLMKRLKEGVIDGIDFGKKMRLKEARRGVLALANGERDFIAWSKDLEALDNGDGQLS
jgi:type II secretory pathway predicted ATPase ExeA